MAETEAPDATTNVVKVTEEIDGDQIPSRNYRFSIIGEPLPIVSDADFTFDMDSLPSRPLAVSERFGVIFVAHSSGFLVARMKDVIDAAEELKNGVEGSCIQELSVVDVSLGKVSILALSADSSMLAASVGLNLYFFSVDGLLNKDHEPLYSKSLDGSSYIKDMQWNPHLEDRYVVLTRDGSLYCGAGQGDLNHVMDNVDAVNWSMNGKFIAVAKLDFLSILSSKFEEKLRIKLLFDSLVDDDPSCVVKVDSVRWVRPDCIMLGCYCLSVDGKEENHLLQFISVKDGKITDPSSPVALNFPDAFLAINEDDIPSGSGPYTFVSYLDEFELAFVANKKNTNQHIALFNWSETGAEMIDIEVDSWVPTINLQVHNDDDNMILGLAINKDYKDEITQLECGEIEKRVSPCCILMCLTVDGRFCMFHFASAIGPSASSEDLSSVSGEEEESPISSSQHLVMNIVNSEKQIEDQDIQKVEISDQKVKVNESSGTQQDVLTVKPSNDQKKEGSFEATLFKASDSNQEVTPVNSASKYVNDKSNKSFFGASTELPIDKSSFGLQGSSGTFTSGSLFSSSGFGVQSSSSPGSFSSGGMFASKSFDMKSPQSSEKQHGTSGTLFSSSVLGAPQSSSSSPGSFYSGGMFSSKSFDLKSLQSSEKQHGTSGTLFSSSVLGAQSSSPSSGSFSSGGMFASKSFDMKSLQSSEKQHGTSGTLFSSSVLGAPQSSSSSSGSFSSGGMFSSKSSDLKSLQSSEKQHGTSGTLFTSSVLGAQTTSSSGSFSSGGMFSSKSSDLKSLQSSHAVVQEKHGTSLGTTQFPFSKPTSGPSTSSNLLPQGASTGAAFTRSLPVVSTFGSSTLSNLLPQGASTGTAFTKSSPVVSNAQPSPAKSFDFKLSDKGNYKNQIPSRLLNTESNLSEQHSVEEMAKELDALLDSIEEPGGFYDASVTAHKASVAELEEGILVLSNRCQKWTDKMHQGFEEVQLLLDKTVQVLARKIYIEAIVKQATDSQYLDIWNHQKLSSELDMKRRHILEINQSLTNQLIELERHLNTLELQRFGDRSDTLMNRKSSHMKHNPPRHVQSLHSLRNTMNAQLTAAEKLSECLSKQMAVLKIDTEPEKKQSVKKELFDTIGISYDDTAFSSPGQEKSRSVLSKSQHLISFYSTAVKTDLKKSQQSAVKGSEPETARRRIDSLDKSWASVDPPKTTVKRRLLQEDRQMSPARLSLPTATLKLNNRLYERSAVSHDIPHSALNMSQIKGSQAVQIKRNPEGQSSSSLWGSYRSDSLSSGSQSTSIVSRDAAKDIHNLTAEKSNRLTFALKPDTVVVKDPKLSEQSKHFPEPSINTAGSPAFNMFQKKPIENSEPSSKSTDGNQQTSIWSRKSPESSAVSSSSPSTAFSGKSFSLEASTRESQSSSASLPVPVTLAPSSFSFKDTSSSSTSAISLGKSSSGFGFKLSTTQTTPASGPSLAFSSFSSTTSSTKPTLNIDLNTFKSGTSESSKPQVVSVADFDSKPSESSSGQTLAKPVVSTPLGSTGQPSPSILSFPSLTSSTKPILNIDLNTSKSEPSKSNPDTSESSKPQVLLVPKFDPKPNENLSGQTLPLQPVVSTSSGSTSQPSTSSISESQLNLNSKPDQPLVAPPAVSSPVVTNPVDAVSGQTNGSDFTVTQEDEMEEEAPDTTQFTLGSLGGFGLGSSPNPNPNPSAPKQNPFGGPFGNAPATTPITSFSTPPSGGLFKPASFSVESQKPSPPPQQTGFGASSGIFGGNNNQSTGGQGFGQPARVGSGQQALGSVLGSFGQSRQFGAGPFGGGFGSSQTAGGFATASSGGGGGFASLASGGGGGFAAAATGSGGFAAAATGGGGFAAAATGGGGFGAVGTSSGGFSSAAPAAGGGFGAAPSLGGGFGAAPSLGGFGAAPSLGGFAAAPASGGFGAAPAAGGGFAGVASGGFGGFSSQGGSGFSTFGSSGGGTAKPPSELFTQMRK